MIPVEFQDAFYAGRRGDVVKFVLNDSVEVTSGEHEGWDHIRGQPWTLDISQDVPEILEDLAENSTVEKRGGEIGKNVVQCPGLTPFS